MLNIADGLVHWTDRNVPGSRIRLEFTIMAKDSTFLVAINALRPDDDQQLAEPIRETFTGLRRDHILAWTVAQAERINTEFGLGDAHIGHLQKELGHVMDVPEGGTNLPFMAQPALEPVRDVDPAPVPEPPAAVQSPATALAADDLMTADDIWEAKVESLNPRSDIASMLTVRKGTNGFAVHLRVEMGTDSAEQFGAVGTVSEVSDWLRKADLAKAIVERLGTEEPTAYQMGRRWAEMFTVPLQQFHLRITQPHLFWSDDERKQRRLTYPRT